MSECVREGEKRRVHVYGRECACEGMEGEGSGGYKERVMGEKTVGVRICKCVCMHCMCPC